jgi:hypothetical protein
MSNLTLHRDSNEPAKPLPQPRVQITVRGAVESDIGFIDDLQKKHSRMVGWFPTKQIEANIKGGHVLIAETVSEPRPSGSGAGDDRSNVEADAARNPLPNAPGNRGSVHRERVGYCIARDKYMKREDCGIIYQLNVAPGEHRKLVGATLIKAVFDRAAYGCKLFCCWCAQDIDANHFWESIGFVPLAFRTGARRSKKLGPRIHIFWQRRIREGDGGPGATPYWFPSQTMGGAVREGRIVLPIPPGTHWSDAKPAVLPGLPANKAAEQLQLESDQEKKTRSRKKSKPVQVPSRNSIAAGGLRFGPSPQEKAAEKAKEQKPKVRYKSDPQYVAAARELRDRYIEQINSAPGNLLPPSACGKYDVSRALEEAPSVMKHPVEEVRLLDAA